RRQTGTIRLEAQLAVLKPVSFDVPPVLAPLQIAGTHELKRLVDALVMMVDDEPINIEVTQIHLEEAGYTRFISTSEPREALDLIRMHRPDVLLLDLMMPGMSGFDILAA